MSPQDFKLYENIFIETNLQSSDYDGVILILYPDEMNVGLPRDIGSYMDKISKIDKHVAKVPTVWNCDYVSGGRLVLSPTGKITPYHDVAVIKDAARKGMQRGLDAGMKKPLFVVNNVVAFPDAQLVSILSVLEALYLPLQMREREEIKSFIRIGFHAEEKRTEAFEKIVRNALALERSRVLTRDIAGGDPERMAPANIVEYVKRSFAENSNITISVIENEEEILENYPLLAAVSRAANQVERHKARVVKLVYNSSDPNRVTETILLVGKGVTYDTGGADIKITGKMAGMSRDKCGAAAVAGFLKACAILKPPHLKVIGFMCLCRNSVGEDSYVADELLLSKSGKTVRVMNTDAEGRLAMADSLYYATEMAGNELNPHIYTIATLTGHASACFGKYTAVMDNHAARATNHATRLQLSGSMVAEGFDVSSVRAIDLAVNAGKCKGDDLLQLDTDAKSRNHQMAAGFLIKVGGLEDKNVKYTHLDIAGSAGMPPEEPTAVPVLSLCSVELFTKERILPVELRALPYDVNSVMHFGERDFSKNGHRSFLFKNPNTQQNRVGLSAIDLQKIQTIYGPECKNRDRLAKIDICRNFPIMTRRKRDVEAETIRNLRINRDITPPPERNLSEDAAKALKDLGIHDEVQDLIDEVHKITSTALKTARLKHCNATKDDLRSTNDDSLATNNILNIVEVVTEYTKSIVTSAVSNLTTFCDDSVNNPQRSCGGNPWCPRSTKVGPVRHSTKHRPVYQQPTRHDGSGKQYQYEYFLRADNSSGAENVTSRKKRETVSLDDGKKADDDKVPDSRGSTPIININNANVSKSILRSATKVISDKTKPNFAPGRRSYENRHYR